jgi:hypothetical protein
MPFFAVPLTQLCSGGAAIDQVAVNTGFELFEDIVQSGDMTLVSSTTTGVTPEPSTFTLLGTGLIGVVGAFSRKCYNVSPAEYRTTDNKALIRLSGLKLSIA